MLRCRAARCSGHFSSCSRVCAGTSAICHQRTFARRQRLKAWVSASALSFTVQGITLSAADLVGFQPHVADAIPGLHHAFSSNIISSSAGSATRAASQQAAAASPPVQQSLAARVAGASQHALQLSMAAAHMPAEAADAARRQLLLSLTARRGSVVTALAVALGAALLLLLAVKLWRWVHRGQRQQAQAAQQEAAAARLATQKQRMLLALDEYAEELPAAQDFRTFEAILEDYQSLLDNTVPTLDGDGIPIGEALINPMYSEADSQAVQQQWQEFVAGAKLNAVRPEAWWDINDVEQHPAMLADDIDWNA